MASRPYFGAIFGHFEPFLALRGVFLTLFGHLGKGQKRVMAADPLKLVANGAGSQNWPVSMAQVASSPLFGAIFGHFEPFWGLLGLF